VAKGGVRLKRGRCKKGKGPEIDQDAEEGGRMVEWVILGGTGKTEDGDRGKSVGKDHAWCGGLPPLTDEWQRESAKTTGGGGGLWVGGKIPIKAKTD